MVDFGVIRFEALIIWDWRGHVGLLRQITSCPLKLASKIVQDFT